MPICHRPCMLGLQVERLEGMLAEKDAELAGAATSSSDLQQELREVRSHCELLEADVEHLQQEARQRQPPGASAAPSTPIDQQLPEQVPMHVSTLKAICKRHITDHLMHFPHQELRIWEQPLLGILGYGRPARYVMTGFLLIRILPC